MSRNATKNFPMSRQSYNAGINTRKDEKNKSKEIDEQISEDDALDESYTSDENVDNSRESSTVQSRTSIHNSGQKKVLKKKHNDNVVYPIQYTQSQNKENDRQSLNWFKDSIIAFALIMFALVMYCNSSDTINVDNKITIELLRENFPKKIEVISSIDYILNDSLQIDPTHPAVILLLYSGSNKLINNLTHHLALYASNLLETNTDYIEIPQKEFHTKEIVTDYGILIEKYKPILLEKRVMVVKDLQNIPATVAQVFHSFCDEISPLVDRAVYLLTLNVNSLNGKEETIAEATLNANWHELHDDILNPLVTRVTSTVLKIEN